MIIKKKESKREKIAQEGYVWDYPMPSEELGISVQKLNGRVPDNGQYMNNECDEICYVISGAGKIFLDGEGFEISQGDVYGISPKQKSYLIADELEILTITRPNWFEEQCEIVGGKK